MKKILLSIILCAVLLIAGISYLSATTNNSCEYHNHGGCKTSANTIVEGKITYDNGTAVGKASISATCAHVLKNGKTHSYTETTKTLNIGALKGTYILTFPQGHCDEKDKVTVTASKGGMTGTNTGLVADFKILKEKCAELDVALVNVVIPTVPEFGLVAGALTIFGALGAFFVVRRK